MSIGLGIAFLLAGAVVLVWVSAKNRAFALPLLVAFAARAALAIIDATVFMLPGQDDSLRYDHFAWYWARNGLGGTFEHIATGASLYTWLASALYAIFDRSRLMMQAINVFFGSLIVLNVARLTLTLGGEQRMARHAAWLTALFPSLVFFSSMMLREIPVAYPLSLGVLYLATWYRERKAAQMIIAVAAVLTSMAFHSGSVAVLFAAGVWLIGSWVRSLFTKRFKNLGRNSLALVAGIAAIGFVLSSDFGMGKFQHVEAGEMDALAETQANYSRGRAGYLKGLHPETSTDVVIQSPLRVTYFLFAPFPWMVSEPADIVGVIDSMLFLGLFFRLWRQRTTFLQRRHAVLVMAVFGAMAFTFAMGVSNYGTAHRHRSKMLPLLIGTALAMPSRRKARSGASIAPPAGVAESVPRASQPAKGLV